MLHERLDWGLAVLRTQNEGGGDLKLPPWYEREDDGSGLFATLERLAAKNEEA